MGPQGVPPLSSPSSASWVARDFPKHGLITVISAGIFSYSKARISLPRTGLLIKCSTLKCNLLFTSSFSSGHTWPQASLSAGQAGRKHLWLPSLPAFGSPRVRRKVNVLLSAAALSCSGPRGSWHLAPPLLCSHWLTTFRSSAQKPGNCSRFPAHQPPSSPPSDGQDLQAGLLSGCQALSPVHVGSCEMWVGTAWPGWEVCCVFVSKPLTLFSWRWGSALNTGSSLLPTETLLGGKGCPTRLYGVSPPVANCCLKLYCG